MSNFFLWTTVLGNIKYSYKETKFTIDVRQF